MNLLDIGNNVRNYLRQGALNLGFKPLSPQQQKQPFLQQYGNAVKSVAQVPQQSINYFNPTSNNGNNFWRTPMAQGMAKTQNFIIPQNRPQQPNMIQSPQNFTDILHNVKSTYNNALNHSPVVTRNPFLNVAADFAMPNFNTPIVGGILRGLPESLNWSKNTAKDIGNSLGNIGSPAPKANQRLQDQINSIREQAKKTTNPTQKAKLLRLANEAQGQLSENYQQDVAGWSPDALKPIWQRAAMTGVEIGGLTDTIANPKLMVDGIVSPIVGAINSAKNPSTAIRTVETGVNTVKNILKGSPQATKQQVAYLKIVGNKSNSKVKLGKSDVPLEVNPFNTPLLRSRETNAQDMVDKLFARPIPGREKIRQLKPKVEFLETKKPSNPLTQEARKYKSAEEFVKAGQEGKLSQDFVKQVQSKLGMNKYQSDWKKWKEGGLKGKMPESPLNDNAIKSQLTDIWNKANKPTVQPKQRGFVSSVKESQNVTKPTKNITIGGYNSKTNDSLMAEAKALLTEGAEVDFSKVKNVDQKVAATIQEALNLDKAGKHNEAAALFNNLAKYGTELGRGVQAFNMLDKMSPEAITKSAARTIQKYNETAGRKIPELTGTQQKLISGAVEKIRGMKDGREKNLAINELQQTINSFVPSTLVDKAITVWKAGLLTSLRTHERNLLGNTVMQVSEAVKNPIAAGADAIMSTFTGQRTKTATARGLQDAFSKQTRQQFVDKAKLGFDPSNEIAGFDVKKVNWNTKNPVEAVLKKYTNAVFNTLSASDTPFFNASFANSLYDQAGAIAINSGKRGNKNFIDSLVKSPTAEMLTQATKDAQYATFKDKNVLSGLAGNIKRKLAEQGGLKGEAGKIIGELTMPFTGVPSSIVAKTVAYSPIGLIKGATTAGRVVTGRVPELQRQASEEIARGVIGTGLFGLGSYLMSKGLMTGQPKDSKEADQWAIEGKQANSVDLFGKWRSINSIGPQNLVILAGAKYNEEMNDPEGGLGSFATKLGKDQLGQTFVQGMSGPINALTDPNRYGKSYVGSTVSSVVPNIVKDIAKSQDQYARETNTTTDYLKQGIPFARNTLLPRRNNIGDVIPQEPTGAGAFLDIFNSKSPVKNKVVDELARLNNVGFEATPSKLKKDQTIQGVKKTLTPQELDTLEAQTGPVLNETLNRLVDSEYYKNLDDEAKSKAIDKIVTDIRRKVKGSINLGDNTLGDINTKITQTKTPTVGQYEILNPETNKIKTIDIDTAIEKPVLTGNTALDKKLISKFNSKLTSRGNDIVALYEDGQIDGKTAEAELTKLTTLKSSTGKGKKGKKGKKITIKKIAGAKKITNIKIAKSASLKPIKIKKLKLKSAKKTKKVGNIKISNYKLPKIKIS